MGCFGWMALTSKTALYIHLVWSSRKTTRCFLLVRRKASKAPSRLQLPAGLVRTVCSEATKRTGCHAGYTPHLTSPMELLLASQVACNVGAPAQHRSRSSVYALVWLTTGP